MAFVTMTSACANCGALFSYNPVRVPSVRIRGSREPVCSECMAELNRKRGAAGLAPIAIAADAYDAVDEQEVPWPSD